MRETGETEMEMAYEVFRKLVGQQELYFCDKRVDLNGLGGRGGKICKMRGYCGG